MHSVVRVLAVAGLTADDLSLNVGTLGALQRLADDRYRIVLELGPPPYAANEVLLGLRGGAVERIGSGELNRPALVRLPLDTYDATLYTFGPLTSFPVGRGGMPDGSDFKGDPDAPGGGSATYNIGPLPAGSYEFFCTIHPNMVGTLTVGP